MAQRRTIEHLIAVVAIFSMLLTAAQVTPAFASSVPQGKGGNPVNTTDAPSTAANTTLSKPNLDLNKVVRVIVQLKDPPLSSYRGGVNNLRPTSPQVNNATRLQVDSLGSIAYTQYLVSQQTTTQNAILAALPAARVERSYQVVLNGFTVSNVRVGDIAKIQALSGVTAVTVEKEYQQEMDSSFPLIGLGTGTLGGPDWVDSGLWQTLGGHANAGKGMKIADIDSGITLSNPCFDPTGFTYPAGFPKFGAGYAAYVTPKVIAARAYFRSDDPPFYPATPVDDPGSGGGGHGTHTAGTMLCNYGTITTFGQGTKISGVAPSAQLMVYRVFYHSLAGSQSAYDPELIAAIEDAVKDGADVVNNSWGGTFVTGGTDDPLASAYESAVDAGVVVVFSAGNSGPNAMTVGSPGGSSDKFITAAASTTDRIFGNKLVLTSANVPDALTNIVGLPSAETNLTSDLTGKEITYSPANLIGCSPPAFPAGFFTGKIAYIKRGTCTFAEKVNYATAAGAIAVVVGNNSVNPTSPIVMSTPGTTIPSFMIDTDLGTALQAYIDAQHAASATVTGDLLAGSFRIANSGWADFLASFSSHGPTPDLGFTPDITAPGVNILSSVSANAFGDSTASFALYQGTSMAAPHVTGSAALMRQLHPDWTPGEIKSALMSTAQEPVALGLNPMDRGSGRLYLNAPDKVGVTFDKPGVSFGLVPFNGVPATDKKSITITATNMTATAIVYTLAVVKSAGVTDTVEVQQSGAPVTTLSVAAQSTAAFDLVLTPAATGAGYGKITFTDQATSPTPALHLPYWDRKVTAVAGKDFLLIDDDGSAPTNVCPDYQAVYTTALTALSYTFDVVDMNLAAIDWNKARQYSKGIIYFEGTGACSNSILNYSTNPDSLRNYMVSGGKMIIFGQDVMSFDAFAATGAYSAYGYNSFLPELFFGAQFVQDDLFRGANPSPAVVGDKVYSTFLNMFAIGLDPTTAVAVDELNAPLYTDMDTLPILSSVPLGTALLDGTVGTRSSTEPTLERVLGTEPWSRFLHRGELVSFGLQDMMNGAATPILNTRADLLDQLVKWLGDQTAIHFNQASYFSNQPGVAVTFSATTSSSLGDVLQCRFDFGDGSPIETVFPNASGICTVNHKFQNMSVHKVLAEVLDSYGHKAVSDTVIVKIGFLSFLAIIAK
jgi:subtilisin family serine protease